MSIRQSKPLKGFTVKAEEEKLKLAKKLQIDLQEIFRRSLDFAIYESSSQCPTCGRKVKKL